MLEFLLKELEVTNERLNELKADSVELSYIDTVYREVYNYLKMLDRNKFQTKKDQRDLIVSMILSCMAYYFTYTSGSMACKFGSGVVTVVALACAYDVVLNSKNKRFYLEKLNEFGVNLDINRENFDEQRLSVSSSLRDINAEYKSLKDYSRELQSIIANPNVFESMTNHASIMKSYLEGEFETFLEESKHMPVENISLESGTKVTSDVKLYKRVI